MRSADASGRIQRDPRERLVRGRLPGSFFDGELGEPGSAHLLALHVQPTQPWKGARPDDGGARGLAVARRGFPGRRIDVAPELHDADSRRGLG